MLFLSIDAALTNSLQQIFARTVEKVEKLTACSLEALEEIIAKGVAAKQFYFLAHNGCLCVHTEDLTMYLRQVSGQPVLSPKDVTSLLRRKNLLWVDGSGKSTRKINGVRMLTIPLNKLPIHSK